MVYERTNTFMVREPKRYEELTFTDDFMFCKIMQSNEKICKELLELILDKKIKLITYPEQQKTIEITSDGKEFTKTKPLLSGDDRFKSD